MAEAEQTEMSMVVIAIDESEEAERAFDYYVSFLHKQGNQVLLVHSAEMPQVPSQQSVWYLNHDVYNSLVTHAKEKILELEGQYVKKMNDNKALLIDGNMWDDAVIEQKAKVKTLEDKFSAKMLENSVPGSIRAMFSNKPGELLVQTAHEEKAIMIVTGSRGLGKMRRTILGSVSDYVLHHAQCPVFICRKGTI